MTKGARGLLRRVAPGRGPAHRMGRTGRRQADDLVGV